MSNIFATTAKASFYNPNGSGRDTYIYVNNGGFTSPKEQNVQPGIGSFTSPKQSSFKMPTINSKSIHYNNNGSGRDSYIS